MATTKKRKTTGAARGRKPAKRKTKARVSGAAATAPATLTIKGAGRYKKVSCGHTKADATKRVRELGAKGSKARTRKSANGWCVYKGGRRKAA